MNFKGNLHTIKTYLFCLCDQKIDKLHFNLSLNQVKCHLFLLQAKNGRDIESKIEREGEK
jgi:hypothetical protein